MKKSEDIIHHPYISMDGMDISQLERMDEAKPEELTSNFKIAMMLTKSALGLGIFILPKLTNSVGYYGFAIFYAVNCGTAVFFVSLALIAMDHYKYTGRR